jgi:hypothetical protein
MAIVTVGPVGAEAPLATGHPGRPPSQRPGDGPAGGGPSGGSQPSVAAADPSPAPQATPLDRVVASALARQDGLAHLFAAAAALSARGGTLPGSLADALSALSGLALADPPDGDALRTALTRSGLFHEALVLGGDPRGGSDMKSILALLRAALGPFLDGLPPHASPDIVRDRAPPPKPGAPTPAEPAVPLPEETDPALLGRRLLAETDHALARVALQQTAVVEETAARPDPARPAAFSATIPVIGPAGVSIASLRVERDPAEDRERPDDPSRRTWRVEIALALDPLGPVEARIGLMPGRRVVAGLWCEAPAAVAPIEAEVARLRTELEAAGIELGAIDVHIGRPPPRPKPAGPVPHRIDLAL